MDDVTEMEGLPMTRTRHAVPRWKVLAALLGAGIAVPVLLAGCGGDTGTAAAGPGGDSRAPGSATANDAPTGPDGLTDRQKTSLEMRRKEENMIAACMRRSGFTYKPYIPQQILHPIPDEPTDYEGLKAQRSKYGFGLFSSHVYKGDPHVTAPEDDDPNDAIVAALDPNQQKAYRLARYGRPPAPRTKDLRPSEGCVGEAVKAVDPQARKRREELARSVSSGQEQPGDAARRAARAQLAPFEPGYASCLHTKGIPTSPGNGPADQEVSNFAFRLVQQRYDQLAFRSRSDGPNLDPDVARRELKQEIKTALDDLECGKQYLPMRNKLTKQLDDAEPPTGGLY